MNTLLKEKAKLQQGQNLVHILMGFVMIVLGIMIINRMNMMWIAIYMTTLIIILYLCIQNAYLAITKKRFGYGLRSLGLMITGFILLQNSNYVVSVITIIFGFWALFNAGIHGLELYLMLRDGFSGSLKKLIAMLFDFILGFLLVTQGHENRLIINIQMGAYIIVYGCVQIFSGFKSLAGDKVSWRLSAPVLYSALFPPIYVNRLKKAMNTHPEDFDHVHTTTEGNRISIYIHVKDFGFERFGHLDLGYKGSIYSYGNYCEEGRSKNSIYGDGVLICGSEVDIIDYSLGQNNIVYQYILELNDQEVLSIEKGMNDLLQDSYFFENRDSKGAYLTNLQERSIYYSFYKFHSQPYKTYNLFTTNCVMLAAAILDSSDHRLFNLSGVITPGTYFSYLEEMVSTQKIKVVRHIHTTEEKKRSLKS